MLSQSATPFEDPKGELSQLELNKLENSWSLDRNGYNLAEAPFGRIHTFVEILP